MWNVSVDSVHLQSRPRHDYNGVSFVYTQRLSKSFHDSLLCSYSTLNS